MKQQFLHCCSSNVGLILHLSLLICIMRPVLSWTTTTTTFTFATTTGAKAIPKTTTTILSAFQSSSSSPHFSSIKHVNNQNCIHHHHQRQGLKKKRLFTCRYMASVSGMAYTAESDSNDNESKTTKFPHVRLFTKEGCTLCDKVKDVLLDLREEYPHSLEQVDITDPEHEDWFSKYKYDIPVLHIGDQFWIKHRIDSDEARKGLTEAQEGKFSARSGEPDAGEMERRQAERQK